MTVTATWNGSVIAESARTVIVEGNHYFPIHDVHREYLQDSALHTNCPWKGQASYYDIVVNGKRNPDAAWYYHNPTPAAGHIAGMVAFWHGVKVAELDDEGVPITGWRKLKRRMGMAAGSGRESSSAGVNGSRHHSTGPSSHAAGSR
jgi:uncharacterized protein (DUF427 family)